MNSLHLLVFVMLNVGVAAPAAASRGVPVATWPGVSDVLLNVVVAAPAAACSSCGQNGSQHPGSVLVFPKHRRGTRETVDQGVLPLTEFEISVKCPEDFDCSTLPDYPNVRLKGHWVCAGDGGPTNPGICHESDFTLRTTVNGTLYLTTEPLADPVTGLPADRVNQANGRYTPIPRPPCQFPEPDGLAREDEAYLILWVMDASGQQIKLDALVGDALLRRGARGNENEATLEEYNAFAIQAGEDIPTGARTDEFGNGNGALDFDGTEYKMVTGVITGTVRYEGPTFATPALKLADTRTARVISHLTLLTLDVLSNRVNDVTFVDFMFYTEGESPHSASTSFVCYVTRSLSGFGGPARPPIDAFLMNSNMGRKGLVVSAPAQHSDGTPVSLLALLEVAERPDVDPFNRRIYAYPLFNNGTPVPTTFVPNEP
jgi:hypothetical protein